MVRVLACSIIASAAAAAASAQVPTALKLKPADATHPEEFTQVNSVRELSDRRLLVVDQRDGPVVALDFASGAVRAVGRQGRGPGAYSRPSRLHALGSDGRAVQTASPTPPTWHQL